MTFLLDVNLLIALIDIAHVHHGLAVEWFEAEGSTSWATCPLTENGVLRIVGGAGYPRPLGSPAAVAPTLKALCALSGHRFWPDSISLIEATHVDATRLLHMRQVTDTYLLALARANDGMLATLDRRLVTAAVRDGAEHVRLIQTPSPLPGTSG